MLAKCRHFHYSLSPHSLVVDAHQVHRVNIQGMIHFLLKQTCCSSNVLWQNNELLSRYLGWWHRKKALKGPYLKPDPWLVHAPQGAKCYELKEKKKTFKVKVFLRNLHFPPILCPRISFQGWEKVRGDVKPFLYGAAASRFQGMLTCWQAAVCQDVFVCCCYFISLLEGHQMEHADIWGWSFRQVQLQTF